MPIKDQPQPSRSDWQYRIVAVTAYSLLTFSSGFICSGNPRVPYSLFVHQVESGTVERASIRQNQIRYQLKPEAGSEQAGDVLATTPIF